MTLILAGMRNCTDPVHQRHQSLSTFWCYTDQIIIIISVVSVPVFSNSVGVGGILDMPPRCRWVSVVDVGRGKVLT